MKIKIRLGDADADADRTEVHQIKSTTSDIDFRRVSKKTKSKRSISTLSGRWLFLILNEY
ncbi:hypothetical protein [Streptococcus suis]|uniref:hypothetical protein n=1 Tax=Streptococcus suis TaxID=1307 RepID=UPI0038B6F27B